jgi:amidase
MPRCIMPDHLIVHLFYRTGSYATVNVDREWSPAEIRESFPHEEYRPGGRMTPGEYARCDGLELVALVKSKQVSPAELAQVALDAIAAVNPKINAVIAPISDWKEQIAAAATESPFYGVPFLIKDILLHARGVPCDAGSRLVKGAFVAPADTDLMQRFRRSGVITLGRTNTPEFGFNANTEPVLYGPTRNPWNPAYSAGGSSGGSAAAVAAGIVPIAHANDGGGSIRLPAAACGLVGLKPTRGRTPVGPELGDPLHGLGIEHVVCRSVRDCAAMLDAVEGPGVGDRYVIARPQRPYLEELHSAPRRLRIAFSAATYGDTVRPDPEVVRALETAARTCADLGHDVEEAKPDYDIGAFHRANIVLWASFLAAGVAGIAEITGRRPSAETLEATVLANYEYGLTLTALDIEVALATTNTVCRSVAPFFERFDLLLTPVWASPGLKLGVLNANDPSLDAKGWYEHLFRHIPYTALYNMTGQPALSLPLAQSSAGMPIGIQAVSRFGGEDTLMQIAGQLEHAMPWKNRRSPIHVSATDA